MTSASVRSRAALAGNPSDGYGGRVVSIPVPHLVATVEVASGPRPSGLVAATIARFESDVQQIDADLTLSIETSIPQSVGLAGSSAIVIAGLRALHALVGSEVDDGWLTRAAHRIERQDLGIAGGWQDQVCQVAGEPVLMDFDSEPTATPIAPGRRIPFFVAWSTAAAEASGDAHAELRQRIDRNTPQIERLRHVASAAADAFVAGDVHALKETMAETLRLRFELMPIRDDHRHMAELAHDHDVPVNFTGSGGAIIGVVPKDPAALFDALADRGLQHTTWEVG